METDSCCGGGKPAFTEWEADALARYIVGHHHGYCREAMPTIAAHARKLAQVHGPAHPELIEMAAIFEDVCKEMASHMLKEEHVLFPYIERLAATRRSGLQPFPAPFGDVGNPIRAMEQEHEHAGAAMARIRELAHGYTVPVDGCTTWRVTLRELEAFEQDLHLHVHLENNVLFPKARALAATPAPAAG